MLSRYPDKADQILDQQNKEIIIDKHSRLIILIPVLALLISIIISVMCVEWRITGTCWIIFAVLLYHFAIERREMYYYVFSRNGIAQCNLFTAKQRAIPWSQITQIGIRKGGRNTGGMLVITILGAPKWNPRRKTSSQAWYYLSNRPNVLILEKWHQAQLLIQTYYGSLDY